MGIILTVTGLAIGGILLGITTTIMVKSLLIAPENPGRATTVIRWTLTGMVSLMWGVLVSAIYLTAQGE